MQSHIVYHLFCYAISFMVVYYKTKNLSKGENKIKHLLLYFFPKIIKVEETFPHPSPGLVEKCWIRIFIFIMCTGRGFCSKWQWYKRTVKKRVQGGGNEATSPWPMMGNGVADILGEEGRWKISKLLWDLGFLAISLSSSMSRYVKGFQTWSQLKHTDS